MFRGGKISLPSSSVDYTFDPAQYCCCFWYVVLARDRHRTNPLSLISDTLSDFLGGEATSKRAKTAVSHVCRGCTITASASIFLRLCSHLIVRCSLQISQVQEELQGRDLANGFGKCCTHLSSSIYLDDQSIGHDVKKKALTSWCIVHCREALERKPSRLVNGRQDQ